jgi:hypothetical protein
MPGKPGKPGFIGFTPVPTSVTDDFIVTHNSHLGMREVLWHATMTHPYQPPITMDTIWCGFPDYLAHVAPRLAAEAGGDLLVAIGTERDSLASLVSYKLDLRGPSVTVQTFCSTSLVAVHFAVQSLLNYESDLAIAGGASNGNSGRSIADARRN